ncbi:asparagine synthase (glutamine-hydrolyzing) [Nitrosophilus alvini]|uniref:asparagine synthase (glutamine-hydrolyzing) n=1 Tax=Nitrosophilus alvini TaxID=2714855 RepID=UPI00190B4792|nr:asparagine synthase (glutamine-hydrolyzing) [Nitrosophilus alvini]
MCGIAGFIDFNKKSDKLVLKIMTDVLHHRGPDDSGYSFYDLNNANIGLGHRRLSILDLSKHGHQPMSFENLEIVYNGEIYNFKEIKAELEKYGYTFESNSDTEVILKAYHRWNIEAIYKFIGMFAITIYDKKEQEVVLIRDRAGVKPLYYYFKDNLLMFSSELKSFHKNPLFKKEIDLDSLSLYLQYGYIPEPYSIFKWTRKLKAGYYLKIDLKQKKIEEKQYWNIFDFYNKPKLSIDTKEAINETEKLLKSAFEYRMVSDVPVGMFLSGGYDSSAVTALLQSEKTEKIKTFTIGFYEKGYDEAPYAKEVANYLGTDHTEYYCTQKDAVEIIPLLPEIYDEPFGDSSAIPTTLVSRLAREKVTVSLSADGGDEIFGGYGKYNTSLKYYNFFKQFPSFSLPIISKLMNYVNPDFIPVFNKTYNYKTRYEKVKNILKSNSSSKAMQYTSQHFTLKELKKLLKNEPRYIQTNFDLINLLNQNNDDIDQMLAIDYKTYMVDDILTKVDRATMSISLEGREPLLDHRIIEFVAQLPSNLKIKNGEKKWLLKQIVHKYLPKEMMDRPKMGFGVPIVEWFRDELKKYFLTYLDKNRLEKEGIFVSEEVLKLRDSYLQGNKENVQRLWFILIFEMWYERWM